MALNIRNLTIRCLFDDIKKSQISKNFSRLSSSSIEFLKEKLTKYDSPYIYETILSKNASVKNLKRASVLIPISFKEETDSCGKIVTKTFFTLSKRTDKMSSFKGDVSFLGGKRDKNDDSDIATAYREAYEEAGIESKDLTYLAQLCPIITVNRILVTPILAHFNKEEFVPNLNKDEVEMVFDIPTERFLSDNDYRNTTYDTDNGSYLVHHFKDLLQNEKIVETWGYTAFMCIVVSMLLHDRKPPFPVQTVYFESTCINKNLEEFLYKELAEFHDKCE